MKRRSLSRGYTVVEVLSAMTLFAIGAAGVISMQRVTIQGGNDARHFDVASNIAHEWTYRLQRDAMFWNPDAPAPFAATRWVGLVGNASAPWFGPAVPTGAGVAGSSPAYDLLGRERPQASGDHVFCTQIRLQWVADPATTPLGAFMRAEVRVVWPRLETPNIDDCGSFTTAPDPLRYHFVYATTILRSNPPE